MKIWIRHISAHAVFKNSWRILKFTTSSNKFALAIPYVIDEEQKRSVPAKVTTKKLWKLWRKSQNKHISHFVHFWLQITFTAVFLRSQSIFSSVRYGRRLFWQLRNLYCSTTTFDFFIDEDVSASSRVTCQEAARWLSLWNRQYENNSENKAFEVSDNMLMMPKVLLCCIQMEQSRRTLLPQIQWMISMLKTICAC